MTRPLKVHILLVDDEKDIEVLFRVNFSRESRDGKLKISFSTSAQECLDYLMKEDAQDVIIIFSDINMPGMTGLELLPVLRERFPHIYVYMVSAYETSDYVQAAKQKGARGYFTKPVDFPKLKAQIAADVAALDGSSPTL